MAKWHKDERSDDKSKATHPEQIEQPQQFCSKLPDPFSFEQVSLTEAKDGPKMRLLRSRRYSRLYIKFDEKPQDEVIEQLKEAGWIWGQKDRSWFLQLQQGTEVSTTIEAERIFQYLANQIRESQGLEPVSGIGSAKS